MDTDRSREEKANSSCDVFVFTNYVNYNEKELNKQGAFKDGEGNSLVALHWQHRYNHMVGRYNEVYRGQMPNITPHMCRHTYCFNMEKSGMNPMPRSGICILDEETEI